MRGLRDFLRLGCQISALSVLIWIDQAFAESATLAFANSYINHVVSERKDVKILERSSEHENMDSWREFVNPTFRVNLGSKQVVRIVFHDADLDESFAILVFPLPDSFKQTFTSFEQILIIGQLHSKAPNFYAACSNDQVFAILFSEKKGFQITSPLVKILTDELVKNKAPTPPGK